METDFFAYSRRKIEKDNEEGHFEAAHNREMALRCFVNFLGKEELSLNELTPELMVKFEEWLNTKGRKQSTTRLYLYQISSVYNIAVKEGIVPKLKLLKGVRVVKEYFTYVFSRLIEGEKDYEKLLPSAVAR